MNILTSKHIALGWLARILMLEISSSLDISGNGTTLLHNDKLLLETHSQSSKTNFTSNASFLKLTSEKPFPKINVTSTGSPFVSDEKLFKIERKRRNIKRDKRYLSKNPKFNLIKKRDVNSLNWIPISNNPNDSKSHFKLEKSPESDTKSEGKVLISLEKSSSQVSGEILKNVTNTTKDANISKKGKPGDDSEKSGNVSVKPANVLEKSSVDSGKSANVLEKSVDYSGKSIGLFQAGNYSDQILTKIGPVPIKSKLSENEKLIQSFSEVFRKIVAPEPLKSDHISIKFDENPKQQLENPRSLLLTESVKKMISPDSLASNRPYEKISDASRHFESNFGSSHPGNAAFYPFDTISPTFLDLQGELPPVCQRNVKRSPYATSISPLLPPYRAPTTIYPQHPYNGFQPYAAATPRQYQYVPNFNGNWPYQYSPPCSQQPVPCQFMQPPTETLDSENEAYPPEPAANENFPQLPFGNQQPAFGSNYQGQSTCCHELQAVAGSTNLSQPGNLLQTSTVGDNSKGLSGGNAAQSKLDHSQSPATGSDDIRRPSSPFDDNSQQLPQFGQTNAPTDIGFQSNNNAQTATRTSASVEQPSGQPAIFSSPAAGDGPATQLSTMPAEVKEFMEMLPQIMSMPESSAMNGPTSPYKPRFPTRASYSKPYKYYKPQNFYDNAAYNYRTNDLFY